MDRDEAERVVCSDGWLAEQPSAFRRRLLARARLRTFAPGDYAFHLADPLGGIFGVVDGAFGVFLDGDAPYAPLVHIVHAGAWFGHRPLLARRPRIMAFCAREPTVAWQVPLAVLDELTATDPDDLRRLASLSEFNWGIATRTVADLLIRRADRRIAAVLLRVAGLVPETPAPATGPVRVSQAELAEMANASRDLVNRTLGRFAHAGWITVGYQQVHVRDARALHDFAYQGEPVETVTVARCPTTAADGRHVRTSAHP